MSAVAIVQSNVETVVDAICDSIRLSLQAGTGSSFESLKAHAQVGQGLIDLKEHLPRNFGREVESRFGLKKQWRARLMKLAAKWADVLAAIELARKTGQMTRSEYSVDGALALIAAPKRERDSAKRNAKALSVAQFLVTILDWNGVSELLSLLDETDWHRVEEYLRSSGSWLDGKWQLSADDEIENRVWGEGGKVMELVRDARSRGTATTDAIAKRAMSLEVNS